jgi:hypothetical protein
MNQPVYEGHELCGDLAAGQMCFKARRYQGGVWEDVCHEHVPRSRLSQEGAREVLRSLVAHFSDWPPQFIVGSYLNRRGKNPATYPGFMSQTTYPEPGALRQYVSSPAVTAWCDDAYSAADFRPAAPM